MFIGLGLARAAVLLVPFPRLSRRFGQSMGAVALVPLATPSDARTAARVGRVIRAVALRTPWESNCLAQSDPCAGLARAAARSYALHLGLRSSPAVADDPIAHAWWPVRRVFVTGATASRTTRWWRSSVPTGWVSDAPASSAAIKGLR
ncbi:MAG: lasso peptide biosynthesis B2 protein [Thermomonas sp.]|nr:lasso peptide biosynthesis B2 protein [Thermomonas sp.]